MINRVLEIGIVFFIILLAELSCGCISGNSSSNDKKKEEEIIEGEATIIGFKYDFESDGGYKVNSTINCQYKNIDIYIVFVYCYYFWESEEDYWNAGINYVVERPVEKSSNSTTIVLVDISDNIASLCNNTGDPPDKIKVEICDPEQVPYDSETYDNLEPGYIMGDL